MLAPTGTIGLMMDCDTTGVEPDLALVKFKKLVGGGSMQIVNQTVPRALRTMGYQEEQVEAIVEYIAEHGHVVELVRRLAGRLGHGLVAGSAAQRMEDVASLGSRTRHASSIIPSRPVSPAARLPTRSRPSRGSGCQTGTNRLKCA